MFHREKSKEFQENMLKNFAKVRCTMPSLSHLSLIDIADDKLRA